MKNFIITDGQRIPGYTASNYDYWDTVIKATGTNEDWLNGQREAVKVGVQNNYDALLDFKIKPIPCFEGFEYLRVSGTFVNLNA